MAASQDPFASISDKYTVHPESYEFVRRGVSLGLKPVQDQSVEENRRTRAEVTYQLTGTIDFPGSDTEIIVPSPYSSEGIPISVYKPSSCPEKPAIVVYYHGGGLVLGSRKSHEAMAKILARDSGAIVLNVEYRLLPRETEKMAPFEDAVIVAKWALANRVTVGGHPESKLGVAGDSGGGQLAICATNELPGQFDFQVLIYPMCDTSAKQESLKEFSDTPGLTAAAIDFFFGNSFGHLPDAFTNPTINPAVRTNVETSPPALIVLAELDALRDMGLEYADRLRANGVPVECHMIKGVVHAFFSLPDIFKTKCAEAYEHIVRFLKNYQ